MRTRLMHFSIPLVMGLLSACATIGHEFTSEPVAEVKIGETTQADVRRLFGDPWRTGLEDGEPTWTYAHYRYALFGRARAKDLKISFDAQGRVTSYTYSSTPDAP